MSTKNKQTAKPSRQLMRGFTVTNIDTLTVNVTKRERPEGLAGFGTIIWLDDLETPVPVTFRAGTGFWARARANGMITVEKAHDSTWCNSYTLAEFAGLFAPKHATDAII